MKQIRYNSTAAPLRLDLPTEWDATLLTALTLTVTDRDGVELLAADAATLYTATTLAADAGRFLGSITLAAGAGDLAPGDAIMIDGIAGPDRRVVKGYDSTNKVAELDTILDADHVTGDDVYGLFTTYSFDTSTVADFPAGIILTLTWTPTGTGVPITQVAQIAKSAMDIAGFELRFSEIYQRAHDGLTKPRDRFADVLAQAESRVGNELEGEGLNLDRIIDQSKLEPMIQALVAWMWTWDGDEAKKDEREFFGNQYAAQKAQVLAWPIWSDDDQDKIEDEGEVASHPYTFARRW